MAKTTNRTGRFKLPARLRNKRKTAGDFSARVALIDRISDLPGIQTVERNDETTPRRVQIYLRHKVFDHEIGRKARQMLCSLDCIGVFLNGLDRWERYQVLANGWGKLVGHEVCVYLPRDGHELDIVWSVVQRAYERLMVPSTPEAGSLVISTWDWPRVSRTSLQ